MTTKLYSFITFLCIVFIFSACQKEFTFDDSNTVGTTSGTAVFTLAGAPGNCSSPVINGIFQAGTVLDTTNRITLQVNVTAAGTYSISSGSANGIKFSATGTFSLTGLQTISFSSTG